MVELEKRLWSLVLNPAHHSSQQLLCPLKPIGLRQITLRTKLLHLALERSHHHRHLHKLLEQLSDFFELSFQGDLQEF